jgi:AcrR family transcriptional regulator
MASKARSRIIDAAIALYADHGYFGVTVRDLARKAKTTEGTLYRVLDSREKTFAAALTTVLDRLLDPAQLALMIFENPKKQDFAPLMASVVRRWYSGMPEQSARFLMQAYWSQNEEWRDKAYAPIEKTIRLLATSIEREMEQAQTARLDALAASRTLILSLFQFKLTAPAKAGKQESQAVEAMIRHWLRGLSPG